MFWYSRLGFCPAAKRLKYAAGRPGDRPESVTAQITNGEIKQQEQWLIYAAFGASLPVFADLGGAAGRIVTAACLFNHALAPKPPVPCYGPLPAGFRAAAITKPLNSD
jgi:hypothetical protein